MICILTDKTTLAHNLAKLLDTSAVPYSLNTSRSKRTVDAMYQENITAAIVDPYISNINEQAWFDMLETLAQRIPVVVLSTKASKKNSVSPRSAGSLAWLLNPSADDIVSFLSSCGLAGLSSRPLNSRNVSVYNPQIPIHIMQNHGALSVLTVNATGFRKVAVEFGPEAYNKLQDVFQNLLCDMWGGSGNFRTNDVLVRKTPSSNIYYIFVEQSRVTNSVPGPGILEKLSDRIAIRLQNAMWNEIFMEKGKKRIPACVTVVPKFSVGHMTVLHNPCVEINEQIELAFESSIESSRVQLKRLEDRQRELLQTLIQSKDMLCPHYQAVFQLQPLTKEMVDESVAQKSIKPFESILFGFESLIRVRKDLFEKKIGQDSLFPFESRYLRPDILFGLAQGVKVSLELDQVCLLLGITQGVDLPGELMVNILPRNLYHIEKLEHLLTARGSIIFELSESEALNNFELMHSIQSYLKRMNFKVAADDFGKGFASLERIIKIKPELIKLDRSLVENIHQDMSKVAFVRGVVQAARTVNSLILAEGVELWEEAETVQKLGIDLIQGFLLHKPQAFESIQEDLHLESSADNANLKNIKVA